ncbi:MAG: tRNA pseudouridine(38-40) synthase TruA [Bacteroidota bacterium]
MAKYFLRLSYNGGQYRGWQRQPNAPSVQQNLEEALQKVFKQKINCIACGRTDAGVHASQFFCHIKIAEAVQFDLVGRLNRILPTDISISEVIEVPRDAHAQHDAVSRTYDYYFHTFRDAFLSPLSTYYPPEKLAIARMDSVVQQLLGTHDFRGFCKQPDLYKHTRCTLTAARLFAHPSKNQWCIRLSANRFLRGMVRIVVANLLELAYGRMTEKAFSDCLQNGDAPPHFNAAYPQGLYLSKVEYPYLKRPMANLLNTNWGLHSP